MNLQQQIEKELDKKMQQEIDKEILWGMLKELGWTRVMLDRLKDNRHAVDISYWLIENIKNPYHRDGRDFIFENPKDAIMFILRWV